VTALPSYVLDTSAFINGWNHHYRLPVFQGVWDAIGQAMDAGDVLAPEEVMVELSRRSGDPLHTWATTHSAAFIPPDSTWMPHFPTIRAAAPHWFTGGAGHDADPFVVAMAMAMALPVVTYEGQAFSGNPAQVRVLRRSMPVVCAGVGVAVATMFDVLNSLGVTL
jgi:hypothetical protein